MDQSRFNQDKIEEIAQQVLKAIASNRTSKQKGVFESMDEAIEAAQKAYALFASYNIAQREAMIKKIRELTINEAETMAEMGVSETGMGNALHKTLKHRLVAEKTPGTEDLTTHAWSGDRGLTLVEMAPYGLIGAITPVTNPSETIICNSIGMIAAGNGVVFNPHPNAKKVSCYSVDLVNRAILLAGGPENLVCAVNQPTLETADIMMKHPKIKMLVATGGPGVVKALLSSGKKAIGAGAGNPPVVVDQTADIKKAARDIIDGCSFDNNLPCIAEKEVFALDSIYEELISEMQKCGAYLLDQEQVEKLKTLVMTEKGLNRACVGRSAKALLGMIGHSCNDGVTCLICKTEANHLFVQEELMMPILPIVKAESFSQAVKMAVEAEHGYRHSAHMHSKCIDNLTAFAKAVQTTIFLKNAPSYAGIGVGSQGYTTFTIAGPTGEGLTSAKNFARQRRCVLVDALSII